MTETWQEDRWAYNGRNFQFRLYEDVQGEQPSVFVVQPLDSEPMGTTEALGAQVALEAQTGVEPGQSRLWELTPDGSLYEHGPSASRENEVNPDTQMSAGPSFTRTEIAPEMAQEITGHEIQSYEQSMERQWIELSGPEASYD